MIQNIFLKNRNRFFIYVFIFLILTSFNACSNKEITSSEVTNENSGNLIDNGDFSNGTYFPWKSSQREDLEISADSALIVQSSSCPSYIFAYQNVSCEPGRTYNIKCDVLKDPTALKLEVCATYGNKNDACFAVWIDDPYSVVFNYTTLDDSIYTQTEFSVQLRVYRRGGTSYTCQGKFDNIEVSLN